ncbi:MAG: DUF262 domain-containing protein [Acidimicrobiaceae bacterium]|nr:DUF262 domain-containing protein [Acidimicrobiaceae bacterium]
MDIKQIVGTARSVSQLLSHTRYGLDFYQREYKWAEVQVEELINDLSSHFLSEYEPSHERRHVESYLPYFLGSIVTARRDGVCYLVDGQQRITTLTLLLICMRRWLADTHPEDANSLEQLIYSRYMGRRTFNLDVGEREKCLTSILENTGFDTGNESESVRNLWDRYRYIDDHFPEDLRGQDEWILPYFADWLQHRVTFVEISVSDQDMALEIFETINARGLNLSNIDMLKGYLIARVGDEHVIHDLNTRWRERVTELTDCKENADTEFVKAWLRGNYAETIRKRKAKASPGDFDIIGTAFHKWVRDNIERLGIDGEDDYRRFVEHEFFKLSERYIELLDMTRTFRDGLESVIYNSWTSLSMPLQRTMILAAVTPDDDDDTFRKKVALVAGALDIYVVRRIVNYRNCGYSTIVYTMFNLMKDLRNQPIEIVRDVLSEWLENEEERLDGMLRQVLHGGNKRRIRYLLARMTSWLDTERSTGVSFYEYMDSNRTYPFEVEHIWANHYDRHAHEFESEHDFQQHRNKIGGLLLLPKNFNASYRDMPYGEKVEHYNSQNPLARSLHPMAYKNNPAFQRLCDDHSLAFKPYPSEFTKEDIDERQELYRDLAKVIWNPARFELDASV